MVEYRNEGGRNNGDLIVTTAQLREWCAAGQRTVLNAIKEIGEFRHIKLKRGKPGAVGYGQANRFGLKWMPKVGVDVSDPKATTRQVVSSKPGTKKRGSGQSVVVLLDTTSVVVPQNTTTVENSNSSCVKEMPENIEVHGSQENHYLNLAIQRTAAMQPLGGERAGGRTRHEQVSAVRVLNDLGE